MTTPRKKLKQEINDYHDRRAVIKQILETATPTDEGYLVPGELIDRLRQTTEQAS
jgi:hypothetical protein